MTCFSFFEKRYYWTYLCLIAGTAIYFNSIIQCFNATALMLFTIFPHRLSIVFGFMGWMMYTLTIIVRDYSGITSTMVRLDKLSQPWWAQNRTIKGTFGMFGILTIILLKGNFRLYFHELYSDISELTWLFMYLSSSVCRCEIIIASNYCWWLILIKFNFQY